MSRCKIAIIGSGPAGISAACRAAEMGDSHVLLEAQPHLCNTIYRYQKRKHVMAEPSALPLRAACRFEAGRREDLLARWDEDVHQRGVNRRLNAAVVAVKAGESGFLLSLSDGHTVEADNVVMAIGVQGNLRRLGCAGEDLDRVQYQLDDPDEYVDEVIVVVGAGDAAIENAVALAGRNEVHIVNRKGEFSRSKDGNNAAILKAIEEGRIRCHYHASPEQVLASAGPKPLQLTLNSKDGTLLLPCDRIIGRLGATPPREFLEGCGVRFTSSHAAALPALSSQYESSVPGLYVIGALAGNPLIKQAINQGYEVVERIARRPVVPADEPLLREKLAPLLDGRTDVASAIEKVGKSAAVFAKLTALQLREFLLESTLHTPKAGDVIYLAGTFGTSMFVIVSGEVGIQLDETGMSAMRTIRAGRIFGEMALISGRPRSAAVMATEDCVLVEVPRRAMLKLMAAEESVKSVIDQTFAERAIQTFIAPEADEAMLATVVSAARQCVFKANEVIFDVGQEASEIHLIRSGSVMVGTAEGGEQAVLAYVAAGQYFGEEDVIAGTLRTQRVQAAVKTETLSIPADRFRLLLEAHPEIHEAVRLRFRDRIRQRQEMAKSPGRGALMHFLLGEGLGEATDALLIDESLCVRCDQCETACAATHGNVSRLDREAGATFEGLHVPTSCRHCEHPHCMKECPPDAIHRAPNGEVYIDDTCIGCGNCERNCPYGVIQMGVAEDTTPSLWQWLVLGRGSAPGKPVAKKANKDEVKKAVKCDMCRGRDQGPACVQACPTGAAIRVGPEEYFALISRGDR